MVPSRAFPSSIAISTPEDGRRAVADLKRRGADFIKLQSLIPREARLRHRRRSKKTGNPFEGHVPDSVRASEMSEAGMKSFEHLIGIFEGSSPAEDDFLKGGKTEGRFLATYDPARAASLAAHSRQESDLAMPYAGLGTRRQSDRRDRFRQRCAREICSRFVEKRRRGRRFTDEITQGYGADDLAIAEAIQSRRNWKSWSCCTKAGVPFLAGTDTPAGVYVFPGFSLHEELQRFVAAGFTPLEALQTATLNPARFFGMEDQLGTVEKGKLADLVLLNANPLEDIANTQKIAAVIVNGRYLSSKELQKLLDGVEAAARD